MIYSCTLNPSIDYVMSVHEFEAAGLNRAHQTFYYPGGKGINVSRVMSRLGVDTAALGFIGGFTGEFVKNFLSKENVSHQFVDTGQTTRVNVKLKSSNETEINGPGPNLTENHQQKLLEQVRSLTEEDTLVLAGSVPSSLPSDFYNTIADICYKNGTKFVADTSGDALKNLIGHPLFFLKPNHHELGELFSTNVDSIDKAAHYAAKLLDEGVKHVVISMGGAGAVYVGENKRLVANVPKGKVKNSVGAGDSLVSGFIAALHKGESVEEAFRYGVAAGSATAFNDDLCERDDVENLLNEIAISSINEEGINQ
ncbi:1-phosphofructokinase [Halobacillus mangrovi]|uniref:Tagatose-6-phosphate kinase n=1 Tax=Halobacillus mangrovi TaxID=402384 RepID=A0A1W5ZTK7_9BACI|nr:1-phosphofructokinase [Halobacillus mangrovi]ARI76591.1 1-phosphofructokinase [Halobacillus mangrovi]